MSFLPSLRSSCSSASACSSSSSSAITTSRRSIRHVPKPANVPKFKQLLHPQGWVAPLPSGATFVYNPPPTVPSNKFTVTPLNPILSKTGKVLPTGWQRVPGYGHLAPRLDRKEEGLENSSVQYVVPEAVKAEIKALRMQNPGAWTNTTLGTKFSLPPLVVSRIAHNPALRRFQQEDYDLRRERMPWKQVLTGDGRRIQKSFW
ncbi:hypothetical protein BDY24DRAFT_392749 [Mrakia frigida]|uniref:uncharacterized protein n=1 Tax=Mrakia frigida TaxID=29902 RepID=UPI003FCC1E5C